MTTATDGDALSPPAPSHQDRAREEILRWAENALAHAPTVRAVLLVHVQAVEYTLRLVPDLRERTAVLTEVCNLGETRLSSLRPASPD